VSPKKTGSTKTDNAAYSALRYCLTS